MNATPSTPPTHSAGRCGRTWVIAALSSLLLLTACEAKTVSEPEVLGTIVDGQTKQPIQGALIYGFYATSGGGTLAGGSKFGEHIKSFEVESNEKGEFVLPAWDLGDRAVKGELGSRFPMIAIYKPGYALNYQNLQSVRQWFPLPGRLGDTPVKRASAPERIDWRGVPHEMTPTKNEAERYAALNNSSVPMMMVGECGWESYSKVLLVQHNELKDFYKRNLPANAIDGNGYVKDTGPKPPEIQRLSLVFKTPIDRLKEQHSRSAAPWKCANPAAVFAGAK
jgi:hypothetical protein